jgi:hypothetical protein
MKFALQSFSFFVAVVKLHHFLKQKNIENQAIVLKFDEFIYVSYKFILLKKELIINNLQNNISLIKSFLLQSLQKPLQSFLN